MPSPARPTRRSPNCFRRPSRLSARIADQIDAEIEADGFTEVRLTGEADTHTLPLLDWRALVDSDAEGASFELLPGDPGDPREIAAALSTWRPDFQPALQAGELMVMPAPTVAASRLRAVKCRVTDPVVFALAEGSRVARFPNVRGWSAEDTARRAVTEARTEPEAARARTFLESLREGSPELELNAAGAVQHA